MTAARPLSPTAPNWDGDPATLTDEQLDGRVHALALWIANSAADASRTIRQRDLAGYRACCDERSRRLGFTPYTWGR